MTTENKPDNSEKSLADTTASVQPQNAVTPTPTANTPKPRRVFSAQERWLTFISVGIGVLFDRLVINNLFREEIPFFSGIFWLLYLAAFYLFFWQRLKHNKVLWVICGFSAAICVWNLIFDSQTPYGWISFLVIPVVLMSHAVFFGGDFKLKNVSGFFVEWLAGWFIKPLSAIPLFFGALGSATKDEKKSTTKKVLAALAISSAMLFIIIPLLTSADKVFSYYLSVLIGDFNIANTISHTFAIVITSILFYSFLWNIGFAPKAATKNIVKKRVEFDVLISCIVLGSVILTYLLFCVVQFTYLFAGAGLPGDMTYSEYAREGFAQIIVICGINLIIFGVFLHYAKKKPVILIMLISLLLLTAVILISGFVRLNLYINAYGLTWLRLLSLWFIIYLAMVIILSAVRMAKEKLPLIGVCALLLLGWYTALGYANPDALVLKYNLAANNYSVDWLENNREYLRYDISDNGIIVLLESGIDTEYFEHLVNPPHGNSLSSIRAKQMWNDHNLND